MNELMHFQEVENKAKIIMTNFSRRNSLLSLLHALGDLPGLPLQNFKAVNPGEASEEHPILKILPEL